MNLLKAIKKVWDILTTIIVILVILFAVLMVGVRAFGLEPYVVISGSMAKEFPVGSVIYVKDVEPTEIEVGDIITYRLTGTTLSTHRVIGVDMENRCFNTKGDENATEDGAPVSFDDLVGMPVFSIPYIGFVANFVQHSPGMYVAISAGGILLILTFLLDYLSKDADKEDTVPEAAEETASLPEGVPAPSDEEEAVPEADVTEATEAEGVPDPDPEDALAPEAEEVPASKVAAEPAEEAEGVPAPETDEAKTPDANGDTPAPDEGDEKAE